MEEAEELREPFLVLLTEKKNFNVILESYSGVYVRRLNSLHLGREGKKLTSYRKPSLLATEKWPKENPAPAPAPADCKERPDFSDNKAETYLEIDTLRTKLAAHTQRHRCHSPQQS
jgi:hypothetical protein